MNGAERVCINPVTKLFGIYTLKQIECESQRKDIYMKLSQNSLVYINFSQLNGKVRLYKLSLNFMGYILLPLVYEVDSVQAKTCDKKC